MKTETVEFKRMLTPTNASREVERILKGETGHQPDIRDLVPEEDAKLIDVEVEECITMARTMISMDKRVKELKEKFVRIVSGLGLPEDVGFKCVSGSVTIREQSRSSLKEDLLLAKISAQELDACRVSGDPYLIVSIKPTNKTGSAT